MPAAVTPLNEAAGVGALVRPGSVSAAAGTLGSVLGSGLGSGLVSVVVFVATAGVAGVEAVVSDFSADLALAFLRISEAEGIELTGANLARALLSLLWLLKLIKFFKDVNSSLMSFNSSVRFSLVKFKFFSMLFFRLSISSFMSRRSSSNVNLSLLYLDKNSLTLLIVVSISASFSSLACLISFCSTANWSNNLSILMNSSSIFCLSSSMVVCEGGTMLGIKYFVTTW